MSAAIASDAVQAAHRDASFERLARLRTEAELAACTQHMQQLQGKLRATQSQLHAAEQAIAAAKLGEGRADAAAARLAAAQEDIGALQEQLKAARAESSRRGAMLKAVQV
jgi:chromosome segregation ATPase